MSWKQPTPSEFTHNSHHDVAGDMLLTYIWQLVKHEDAIVTIKHGNKTFQIPLKKGQALVRLNQIKNSLGVSYKKIANTLKRVIERENEKNNEIVMEGHPFGRILTFKNADELFALDSPKKERKGKRKGNRRENEGKTPLIENKENKENKREYKSVEFKSWLDWFNQYFDSKYSSDLSPLYFQRRRRFSDEELREAAAAMRDDPHMMGRNPASNPSGTRYATPEYILRNDANVDRFLNRPKRAKGF